MIVLGPAPSASRSATNSISRFVVRSASRAPPRRRSSMVRDALLDRLCTLFAVAFRYSARIVANFDSANL